jgi:clan AA aspartic protease (TIGR02281 family)
MKTLHIIIILLLSSFSVNAEEIQLYKIAGIYQVPVQLNDVLTLNFILDTGATDVSISEEILLTLIRSGTINKKDIIGETNYVLADGSTRKSIRFIIRKIRVGNQILKDVTASLSQKLAPLLLGQSFLEKLGTWSIDSKRKVLILNSTQEPIQNQDLSLGCPFRMEQFFNASTYKEKPKNTWYCRERSGDFQFLIFADGTGITSAQGPFIWEAKECQTVVYKTKYGIGKAAEINGDINYGVITFKDSFEGSESMAVCVARPLEKGKTQKKELYF